MTPLVDKWISRGHPRSKSRTARDILGTLGWASAGGVEDDDAARLLKPQDRVHFSLAVGVVAGMLAAVGLGEFAARHVMRIDPPGGLAEADARARAASGADRWWVEALETRVPTLLPPARIPALVPPATVPALFPPERVPDQPDHAIAAPLERTVLIGKGDTLLDVLLRAGASAPEARDAVDAMKAVYNPRGLKPGLPLTATFGPGVGGRHRLLEVSLPAGFEHTVKVERGDDDEFNASRVARPLAREVVRTAGVIHSSLYEDGVGAGLPAPLVAELIRAFSYDVDFQREIQEGDRFEVAYERFTDGRDQVAKAGNIVYAALALSGRRFKVYRYKPKDGVAGYFNERGESVRKALLRTPIDGARITSGYGMRLHPILGYTTMHKGVDFGAPTSTPIMAAGDGVVEVAGWRGNYGVYLRVRHNSEYSTAYAHMSRIASGIHPGAHVRQGQVIGYVGMTGLATGPHLYYEVLVHNQQINPLSVRLPTGIRLAGAELKTFAAARAKMDAMIATLPPAGRMARTAF